MTFILLVKDVSQNCLNISSTFTEFLLIFIFVSMCMYLSRETDYINHGSDIFFFMYLLATKIIKILDEMFIKKNLYLQIKLH